jgi:hypothetical protein
VDSARCSRSWKGVHDRGELELELELERRMFGPILTAGPKALVPPDCVRIHGELKRHPRVTLTRWEKRLKRSMRQRHLAGEKLSVDYTGRTVPIYGYGGVEAFRAQLFVTAMGGNGCAYAEATCRESLPDWLGSHARALEFYGGAPRIR